MTAPTTENIDSMLEWKDATLLSVHDQADTVVQLFQRVGELSSLKELIYLTVTINADSYRQIKVLPFIENLPRLITLTFIWHTLTEEEIKLFVLNNPKPALVRDIVIEPNSITYKTMSMPAYETVAVNSENLHDTDTSWGFVTNSLWQLLRGVILPIGNAINR